jgi:proteasome assembly chaperone (PAC2) family protein
MVSPILPVCRTAMSIYFLVLTLLLETPIMKKKQKSTKNIKFENPVMIIGLEGWVNAGKVSTFSVKYLLDKFGAKKFGEIPVDEFHDYMLFRPSVSVKEGIIQSYNPPKNEFFRSKDEKNKKSLILLLGYEPHRNWPRYAEAVLKVAKENGVKRIYTIGGFLADISYQGTTPISASTNNEKILPELKKVGVELTNYTGPTSIYSEMMMEAEEKEIDVVSLWSAVPLHVAGVYPRAAYHILEKIAHLTGLELDLTDLKKKAEIFEAEFQKETAGQPDMRELIEGYRGITTQEKEPSYIF